MENSTWAHGSKLFMVSLMVEGKKVSGKDNWKLI